MSRPVDVLIVAAFAPELAPLAPLVPVEGAARVGERVVATRAVGIGLARASAGLARALIEYAPRTVVLVGSCGVYPGRAVSDRDVVVSQSIELGDAACLEARAEIPSVLVRERRCDAQLVEQMASRGARVARVANTLSITTDDDLAARYGSAGFDVEHLEAFALDAVPLSIPCVAVLAVANRVGGEARREWKANASRAHAALGALVSGWLG